MRCKAVDRHNMMGGRGFRVEELKIRTFVFRFVGLTSTVSIIYIIIDIYSTHLEYETFLARPPGTITTIRHTNTARRGQCIADSSNLYHLDLKLSTY